MSLSDEAKPKTWGTVYMGTTAFSLDNLEGDARRNWTEADEAAYLERVKERATQMAASILEEARREAETIRAAAREEGYSSGMAEAEQEIAEFQATASESVSAVLSAIQGQCSAIFADWREDLVALLRVAAEKAVGMPLVDNKAGLLEELYVQSVTALENRRNLVVRVNPEDEAAIADIIAMTQARFADLKAWSVKGDPHVTPGGLIVESDDSLADNRLERRTALVNEILSGLSLPQK